MDKTKLVFLDTETTGRGPESRLCQVAYKMGNEEFESLFKPPVPIEIEAMAVSHITNKMVKDKEPFLGSSMRQHLIEIFSTDNILVAHNAQFDLEMLKREQVEVKNFIDTFKLAHHTDQNGEIPRHSLQYLRYYFDLDVADAPAHQALGDVRVLEKLFEYLFQKMILKGGDEKEIIRQMIDISSRPVFVKRFSFGKYNGMLVEEVALSDPGYLRWLLGEKIKTRDNGEENDENWIYTLEHYLK
jgi:DNA polymerase III epsilon subunit-like protein